MWPFVFGGSSPTKGHISITFILMYLGTIIILKNIRIDVLLKIPQHPSIPYLLINMFFIPYLFIILFFAGICLDHLFHYVNTNYIITDKRVLIQSGFLIKDVEIIDFNQITQVKLEIGFFDKFFKTSCGSILLIVADPLPYGSEDDPYVLSKIPNPKNVLNMLKSGLDSKKQELKREY